MEVQIPYLSSQGPSGIQPNLSSPANSSRHTRSQFEQKKWICAEGFYFLSLCSCCLFIIMAKWTAHPSRSSPNAECCLIHEPQAQMTALSLDGKDDAHFNGSSYHTPSAITAFCANTASGLIVWAFWWFLQTPCGISLKVLHRQGAE